MEKENIRKITGMTPYEVMRRMIDSYPDDNIDGLYTGMVVDNDDPDQQGKCKIRVYGIFGDEVPDSDLPWALPDFDFIGSKLGSFIVPPNDALVKVYFDQGNIYQPHYTTKAVHSSNLPSQRTDDYPDTMVFFETDEGDYFTINRSSKVAKFYHNSGTIITMNRNGSVEIEVKDNLDQNVNGDSTENVTGDKEIEARNVELKNKGVALLKAYIKISSTGEVEVSGLNVHIAKQSIGLLTVDGSVVIPTGTGPLNALPTDPITGAPHAGNQCI